MKKYLKNMKIIIKYILIALLLFFSIVVITKDRIVLTKIIFRPPKVVIVKKRNPFSEQKLKKLLKQIHIKFPEIVFAQAKLESGNFKSNIFIKNNNMFGMKMPRTRVTMALKEKNGYAYYSNWKESVIDYAIYQSRYLCKIRNRDEYLQRIGNNYAECRNYVDKLKSIINDSI